MTSRRGSRAARARGTRSRSSEQAAAVAESGQLVGQRLVAAASEEGDVLAEVKRGAREHEHDRRGGQHDCQRMNGAERGRDQNCERDQPARDRHAEERTLLEARALRRRAGACQTDSAIRTSDVGQRTSITSLRRRCRWPSGTGRSRRRSCSGERPPSGPRPPRTPAVHREDEHERARAGGCRQRVGEVLSDDERSAGRAGDDDLEEHRRADGGGGQAGHRPSSQRLALNREMRERTSSTSPM